MLWLLWVGRARHPGPFSGSMSVEVFNVGGWLTHGDLALETSVDFLAVVEHRLVPRWTAKLDVRDLGGHLDTTFRGWSSTLATRVRVVIARLVVVFALPLPFHGRLGVLRSMFIPGALHGIEASYLAESSVCKLRSAFCRVSWSRRQPFAHVGAFLSLLDGPVGCDPSFCVVWFRFRQMRRYLAFRPEEVPRV